MVEERRTGLKIGGLDLRGDNRIEERRTGLKRGGQD